MFWEETDTCEYVFNWRTPAACALKVCESKIILTNDSRLSLVYKLIHLSEAVLQSSVQDLVTGDLH